MSVFSFKFICLLFFVTSCTTTGPSIFGKQSLHEQYGKKITDAGLKETALGREWFAAAEYALSRPMSILLPYKEIGYFASDKPRAVGLRFSAKRGEKLLIQLDRKPTVAFALYADFWKINNEGNPSSLTFFDTSKTSFDYEIAETGSYLLRIQPELLRSGEYTLSITTGASLGYPVAGKNSRLGGIWGDARDAGTRRHEGIDIFAPLRTPVVASEEGIVTAANENNLGGKVVWMRLKGRNYTLYYAHLDEQFVSDGQHVNKGDTLGLIGNTGNARTSTPHLHFGIYAVGGAIDPLPFVDQKVKNPPAISISPDKLRKKHRITSSSRINIDNASIVLKENTLILPHAATNNQYRIELPDGNIAVVPAKSLQTADKALRQLKLKDSAYLYEAPNITALRKRLLPKSESIEVIAFFNDFAYVESESTEGWIPVRKL
ncbi:MAG: M23 family metallopeptidase [Chitinophagaceae bacterium]